jgi:hypothetical protein
VVGAERIAERREGAHVLCLPERLLRVRLDSRLGSSIVSVGVPGHWTTRYPSVSQGCVYTCASDHTGGIDSTYDIHRPTRSFGGEVDENLPFPRPRSRLQLGIVVCINGRVVVLDFEPTSGIQMLEGPPTEEGPVRNTPAHSPAMDVIERFMGSVYPVGFNVVDEEGAVWRAL